MQVDRERPNSADVIDYYGDRQICDQCGATVSTYGDRCAAMLDVPCEGFQTYDMFSHYAASASRESMADKALDKVSRSLGLENNLEKFANKEQKS